jgi:hypothetical protein
VTVTIADSSPARILSLVGIEAFPIRESETAQGITEEEIP